MLFHGVAITVSAISEFKKRDHFVISTSLRVYWWRLKSTGKGSSKNIVPKNEWEYPAKAQKH